MIGFTKVPHFVSAFRLISQGCDLTSGETQIMIENNQKFLSALDM